MGLLFLLKMSIELMYGLENMFWPVDNSAQIATEREEFYDEQEELYIERQDGLVSKILDYNGCIMVFLTLLLQI